MFSLESCWAFIRCFFEIFGIQVYFLWILQTQKRQVLTQKKNTLIFVPTTTILTLALVFVGIIYLSIKVNVDFSEKRVRDPLEVLQKFIRTPLGLLDILLRVGIQYLSFPFQFYIGKEFFFILYDEIKYRSISKKIDELKMYTSHRGVYTEDMVARVDNETYELVR